MKRLPMRKIREALRLRSDGFSGRRVEQSLSVGRATISEYYRVELDRQSMRKTKLKTGDESA
jgi:hypothetical protein